MMEITLSGIETADIPRGRFIEWVWWKLSSVAHYYFPILITLVFVVWYFLCGTLMNTACGWMNGYCAMNFNPTVCSAAVHNMLEGKIKRYLWSFVIFLGFDDASILAGFVGVSYLTFQQRAAAVNSPRPVYCGVAKAAASRIWLHGRSFFLAQETAAYMAFVKMPIRGYKFANCGICLTYHFVEWLLPYYFWLRMQSAEFLLPWFCAQRMFDEMLTRDRA